MNNQKFGYTIIDNQTGEIIGDSVILFFGKPRRYDRNFIKVYPAFLSSVLETDEIAGKAIRLVFYILEKINFNDPYVYLFYKDVCKELKICNKTFYNWLEILIKHNIIKPTHKPFFYKINYYNFVKGSKNEIINNELATNKEIKRAS